MLLLLLSVFLVYCLLYPCLEDMVLRIWQNHPPGPLSIPIVGGAWCLDTGHLPQSLTQLARKYGQVFSIRLGTQGHAVFLNSLSSINAVLLNKSTAKRPFHPLLQYLSAGGFGLMVADPGSLWKTHRQLSRSAMSRYLHCPDNVIHQILEQLCDRFGAKSGSNMDPREDLYWTVFCLFHTLLFGTNLQSHDQIKMQNLLHHHVTIMEALAPSSLLFMFPTLLKFPNKWRNTVKDAIQVRDQMLATEYKKSLQRINTSLKASHTTCEILRNYAPENKTATEDQNHEELKRTDVLREFLTESTRRARNGEKSSPQSEEDTAHDDMFSYKHVAMTLSGLMLAGVDTLSAALEWTLLLLATFPDITIKARREILQTIGNSQPCLKDLKSLPYTEALLRECLRLGSPTGLTPPHISDSDINLDGFIIPKGTPILANIWAVHHNPAHWPDPNILQPERFLDSKGNILPTNHFPHYLPFSRGGRPCVGSVFARSFLFLFLVTFLQKFEVALTTPYDLTGNMRFSMVPSPYKIKLTLLK